jgi:hypothetical protein
LRKSAISKPVFLLAAEMLEIRNTYLEKMCCGTAGVMRSSSGERVWSRVEVQSTTQFQSF